MLELSPQFSSNNPETLGGGGDSVERGVVAESVSVEGLEVEISQTYLRVLVRTRNHIAAIHGSQSKSTQLGLCGSVETLSWTQIPI